MSSAPTVHIDATKFHADPYPVLARLQAETPVAFVPEFGATLFTRRDDIFEQEKRIETFSSVQPDGLMTQLMGQNLMRMDGDAHQAVRRAIFPAFSPRTVRDHWLASFRQAADNILNALGPKGRTDLVSGFAMQLSGEALRVITGLTTMTATQMDQTSQAMIDGISNYGGDGPTKTRCQQATALIDHHIDEMIPLLRRQPDMSLLSVQMQSDLPETSLRANIKLAISGGQNEPRDAIAGTTWALLHHPDQLALVQSGAATWQQAFEEFSRWIAPIGMSPRQVARKDTVCGIDFEPGERVFFMFGAANRDPRHFSNPERFDIQRDTKPALTFGAGPHFCAGAPIARTLISEIALPMLFDRLPDLRLDGDTRFAGWAFRGPCAVPVAWGSTGD